MSEMIYNVKQCCVQRRKKSKGKGEKKNKNTKTEKNCCVEFYVERECTNRFFFSLVFSFSETLAEAKSAFYECKHYQ